MAISQVWIEEGCTACGLCEEIKEAAESCPVDVIRIEES